MALNHEVPDDYLERLEAGDLEVTRDFLRALVEDLRRVPAMYGIDGWSIDCVRAACRGLTVHIGDEGGE